jgi:transcription elongation factor
VVMLPRIDLDASSSIPSPSLFDPEAIKNYAGARTVRLEGDCYIFRRKRYGKDGLLMETIKLARLSLSSDPPREVEMDLFEQSRNPQVLRAIKEELYRSYFKVDDRVEVVTGTFRGYVGWIKSMDAHTASVSFTMEDQDVDVPISELRKRFEKGDFVEVLRGAFVGVQGFVVDEFEHSLVIVEILAFESVDQSPCKEVRLFVNATTAKR